MQSIQSPTKPPAYENFTPKVAPSASMQNLPPHKSTYDILQARVGLKSQLSGKKPPIHMTPMKNDDAKSTRTKTDCDSATQI